MTGQSSILESCFPNDGISTPAPTKLSVPNSFSPSTGTLAASQPCKRRRALDRFSARITDSGLVGSEMAVVYLRHKYSKNHAENTIKETGYTALVLLEFLHETGTTIFKITRQDIIGFVGHLQDRGLQINSVRCRLRIVYAFIKFLVERNILAPGNSVQENPTQETRSSAKSNTGRGHRTSPYFDNHCPGQSINSSSAANRHEDRRTAAGQGGRHRVTGEEDPALSGRKELSGPCGLFQ